MVHDALLKSLRILAHLELLPPSERRLAAETAAKLADALVYVAVIGEFKRGKSGPPSRSSGSASPGRTL
jgi:hypothetical protein